jgi:chromosome segregation ATPase
MSIRLIAQELYQLEQEVERLEKRLKAAPAGTKEDLEEALRKTRAERNRMRRMLEGSKEPPSYRKTPR